MSKKKYQNYVEHPRYGRGPRVTRQAVDSNAFLHWHQGRVHNTAITADLSKQTPATIPVTHYFDLKRHCRRCHRPFLFFAEEQKFWYEELGLPLEADAVCCVGCRRDLRELSRLKARYEKLRTIERDQELAHEMITAAISLVEEGVFGHKVLSSLRSELKRWPSPEFSQKLSQLALDVQQRQANTNSTGGS